MAAAQDIKLDEIGDLYCNELIGDFDTDYEADEVHISDIINSNTGIWKEFPEIGVNLFNYLNSAGQQQNLKNKITSQLLEDGYVINNVSVILNANEELVIFSDATRK